MFFCKPCLFFLLSGQNFVIRNLTVLSDISYFISTYLLVHHQPRRTQWTKPRRQLAWQHYLYKGKEGRYTWSMHIFTCICKMCGQIKALTWVFSSKPQPQYQPSPPGCQACHADCGLRRCPGCPGWMRGWATEETEKSFASNRERIFLKS